MLPISGATGNSNHPYSPLPGKPTHFENMQTNCRTCLKCLQDKGVPCDLHRYGASMEVFTRELKDEPGTSTSRNMAEAARPSGIEFLDPSRELYSVPAYNHDYGTRAASASVHYCHQLQQCQVNGFESRFYPFLVQNPSQHVPIQVQQCQLNGFGSHFYPYLVQNQSQYVPINVLAENHPRHYQYQEFQYFVVMDFEATCEKDRVPRPQEIIEFPSVILSGVTGQLGTYFRTYVRPSCNPLLSDYCKDLTGIQQIQVDQGVTLSEAILLHDTWLENIGIKNTNFAVVTWGNWDCRTALESECRFKKIWKPSYFNRWINLKIPFGKVFGNTNCNLKEAVEMAGLAWQGRHHCGLDDATNTARLMSLLMHRGFKFSITGSTT